VNNIVLELGSLLVALGDGGWSRGHGSSVAQRIKTVRGEGQKVLEDVRCPGRSPSVVVVVQIDNGRWLGPHTLIGNLGERLVVTIAW